MNGCLAREMLWTETACALLVEKYFNNLSRKCRSSSVCGVRPFTFTFRPCLKDNYCELDVMSTLYILCARWRRPHVRVLSLESTRWRARMSAITLRWLQSSGARQHIDVFRVSQLIEKFDRIFSCSLIKPIVFDGVLLFLLLVCSINWSDTRPWL